MWPRGATDELTGGTRLRTGVDLSRVVLNTARGAVPDDHPDPPIYLQMDAEQLAFRDQSFDLVVGEAILHHLDLERCFAKISRILQPAGVAVFIEPLGHNPVLNWYRRQTPGLRTPD